MTITVGADQMVVMESISAEMFAGQSVAAPAVTPSGQIWAQSPVKLGGAVSVVNLKFTMNHQSVALRACSAKLRLPSAELMASMLLEGQVAEAGRERIGNLDERRHWSQGLPLSCQLQGSISGTFAAEKSATFRVTTAMP